MVDFHDRREDPNVDPIKVGLSHQEVMKMMKTVHDQYAVQTQKHYEDNPDENPESVHRWGQRGKVWDYEKGEHVHVGPETIKPVELERREPQTTDTSLPPTGNKTTGHTTHVVTFEYAANRPWRSMWGYNQHTGEMSIWAD